MWINGYLGLGVGIVSGLITEPASGLGYARVAVAFDAIGSNGVAANLTNATFGPVLGSGTPWGTLSVFQLFDSYGNPAWTGTLTAPLTPTPAEYVYLPAGSISLPSTGTLGAVNGSGGLQPAVILPPGTVAGNFATGAVQLGSALAISSGLGYASGASGIGSMFVTPASSGHIGGVIVPSGSVLTVDASGNITMTVQAFTSLLVGAAQLLASGAPAGSGVLWANGGVLVESTSGSLHGAPQFDALTVSGATTFNGLMNVVGQLTAGNFSVLASGALGLGSWDSGHRPAGATGIVGFNSTYGLIEYYAANAWYQLMSTSPNSSGAFTLMINSWLAGLPTSISGLLVGQWWNNSGIPTQVQS
jgi:hypothetical protein